MRLLAGPALSVEHPFAGLRPYEYQDHPLFFGREDQTFSLYRLLDRSRFVAVVGSSGSGKSSLVNAGLLPLLQQESAESGGRTWRWTKMRPGDAPLAALADALMEFAPGGEDVASAAVRRENLAFALRGSSFGLEDALATIEGLANASIVLVVDQFEELFRFTTAAAGTARDRGEEARWRDEAAQFVQLLLEAGRNKARAVHVLITMRSDFIGDCARFHGLPEAVSATQFLVPSLTRAQLRDVIRRPIEKAGATIDPGLVERLLNDGSDEIDQLPVLQHCLMRLWEHAGREPPAPSASSNAPQAEESAACHAPAKYLTLADYWASGGIAHALSRHADEILAGLPGLEIAVELVFRALSEVDKDGRATRRALSLRQLLAETGVPEDDLRKVLDRFRADDCSFLVPAQSVVPTLSLDSRIDVGHEVLLRRWERISPALPGAESATATGEIDWLRKEQDDGRRYRQLLAFAEIGRMTLPVDQVEQFWTWWTSHPRTAAWAERYGGSFAEVQRLLDDSRAAWQAEKERQEAERHDALRREEEAHRLALERDAKRRLRNRIILVATASALLVVLGFVGYWAWKSRADLRALELANSQARQAEREHAALPQPSNLPSPNQPPSPQVPSPPTTQQPERDGLITPTVPCSNASPAAFLDDFKTADRGWGLDDKSKASFIDGQLAIRAEVAKAYTVIYRSLLYKNATVCVDVKSPPTLNTLGPGGGAVFWAVDFSNYYVALVYTDGSYMISRKVNGNWATITPRTKFDRVNQGPSAPNQIKVTTLGSKATIYINTIKVREILGQPPAVGGAVGMYGESEKDQVKDWRFLAISVVNVTPPHVPTEPPPGPIDALKAACQEGRLQSPTRFFTDDFKTVDAAWIGMPSDNAYIANDQLKIKAAIHTSWRIAYWSLVFKEITVCLDLKSPTGMKDPADTNAGVIFWGTNFDNNYYAIVYPDGSFGINRRVNRSIIRVIGKTHADSIKTGEGAINRLKITLSVNAGTLYINDVKVQDFRGQPPEVGSAVGLFGESETNQRDEWSFLGIVVLE